MLYSYCLSQAFPSWCDVTPPPLILRGKAAVAGRILAEPAVHTKPDNAEKGLAEDTSAHFRCAFLTVYEDDRDLLDMESQLINRIFHLNLEGVSLETNPVKVDSLEHTAAIAYKAGGGIVNIEAHYKAHIL